MQKLFSLLLLLAVASPAFGHEFLIKGKVTNANKNAVISVYPEANPFIVSQEIGPDGTFELRGDFPVASQFMLEYKDDSVDSWYEFYLFESDTVVATLDVGEQVNWELEGVPKRSSEGLERARAIWNNVRSTYHLYSDSFLIALSDSLYAAFGDDDLGRVAANSTFLQYIDVIVTEDMKRLYDIYSREEFENLPKFDERFVGLPAYNRLMDQ